jgi:hypothetical protein
LKASLEGFFANGKQHRRSAVRAKKGSSRAAKNYIRTLLKEGRISDRLKQEREKRKEEILVRRPSAPPDRTAS